MGKIVCDAVPFCFGPCATLLALAKSIAKERKHELILLGQGTTLELAAETPYFNQILECDTESEDALRRNAELIKEADLYIDIMNPASLGYIQELGIPRAYIDVLFWMWDGIPEAVASSEMYFIQNFSGVDRNLERFRQRVTNPIIVGPIIDTEVAQLDRKDEITITFGGAESSLTRDSEYPVLLGKCASRALNRVFPASKLRFCSSSNVIKRVNNEIGGDPRISAATINHDRFLEQLRQTKLLLSTPGLTTSLESFFYGVPIVFLPPQNYSQVIQLRKYKESGVGIRSIEWSEIYSDFEIQEYEEESVGVRKVLDVIKKFARDPIAQNNVTSRLESLVKEYPTELLVKQKKYFESLGEPGTEKIRDAIYEFL